MTFSYSPFFFFFLVQSKYTLSSSFIFIKKIAPGGESARVHALYADRSPGRQAGECDDYRQTHGGRTVPRGKISWIGQIDDHLGQLDPVGQIDDDLDHLDPVAGVAR